MLISDICIKRPVFATVLSMLLLLLGLISFNKLQIRGAPAINPPIITINANLDGASALYMEKNVTNILEQAVRTIKGIDYVTSQSSTGSVKINIFFKLSADINMALSDVRSQIAAVAFKLPLDMQIPQASKVDSDSSASLFLIISSNKYSALDLTDIIQKQIVIALERIDAVGSVNINGAKYYTVKINIDPVKLYQYGIDVSAIRSAIINQNIDYPTGLIKTDNINYVVNLNSRIINPEDFKNIVVKQIDDRVILLQDLANVVFEENEQTSILRCNSAPAIGLGIVKRSDSNILALSTQVVAELPKIKKNIPQDIDIQIRYDQAVPIASSINSVFKTVLESLILVFLVIYIFLGSIKATIIPFVTVPVSLIGSFALMHLFGFSINLFSMLAMVLAIGLVVDDAIVVLENSYRYCAQGLTPIEASRKSIKEIGFAVVSMTSTLASVFLPIGFMDGFVGLLFIEFAWTLAFCVIISGFVAITLTPMMCSKMIKQQCINKTKVVIKFAELICYLESRYRFLLSLALQYKKIFISICLTSIKILVLCFYFINKTFIPLEDDGMLMLFFTTPQGYSLTKTDQTAIEIQQIIQLHKDVENFIIRTGQGKGFGFITLKDWSKRSKSQTQIRIELNDKLSKITQSLVYVTNIPSILSGPIQKPVEFNLQSINLNLEQLDQIADKFIEQLRQNPSFTGIEKDLHNSIPSINIIIDKQKAMLYGVSIDSIGHNLTALLALKTINYFLMNDLIYDVIMNFSLQNRSHISDLNKIYIKSINNSMIPLSSIAKVTESSSIESYNHYNNVKTITITADLVDKISFDDAANQLLNIKNKLINPLEVKMEFLGNLKRMQQQSSSLSIVFIIAILFIYLVLSAQFESFKDPLIILCSVPFSITGAIIALALSGNSINLYSNIGIITLVGLVTKNAIMIVEFANQLHAQSHNIIDSITNAARIRFRPILMTSIATGLGALPLIFAHGPGAAARCSIGLVIFGGMIVGTIFTLFVIPFLYAHFKAPKLNPF